MWNNKLKAVTFSFDDGVKQDVRTIEILDKYNLKATFNLNSGRIRVGEEPTWKEIYKNHEVAVHTVNHPKLIELSDEEIIKEIEEDRKTLEKIVGYSIYAMAYPYGTNNINDRVVEVIKNNTPIKFARTTTSTYSFELQQDSLLTFNPTVRLYGDDFFKAFDDFLNVKTDKPQLFYFWGHTYELDMIENGYEIFEDFCKKVSNRPDIFYGTNSECLLCK